MKVASLIIIEKGSVKNNFLFSAHNKTIMNEQIKKSLRTVFSEEMVNDAIKNGKVITEDVQAYISIPTIVPENK